MNQNSNQGIIIINKPSGPTSHDVVARVRRQLSTQRVGHTGTLDPFATGVLLLAAGAATRLIQYTHTLPKEYVATITLGAGSDTDDRTGTITPAAAANIPAEADIRSALAQCIGPIQQVPPAFSAVKIRGRKLYEHARKGESVAAPARPVTIHAIDLMAYTYPALTLKISCSTGTYIRSLARDLGRILNTEAYVEELQRTKIGNFTVKKAVNFDALTSDNIGQHLQSTDALVAHLPHAALSTQNVAQFRQGRAIPWNNSSVPHNQPIAVVDENRILIGVAAYDPSTSALHPRTVLPL